MEGEMLYAICCTSQREFPDAVFLFQEMVKRICLLGFTPLEIRPRLCYRWAQAAGDPF